MQNQQLIKKNKNVNTYAVNIFLLCKSALSLSYIAGNLKLSHDELVEKMKDESKVTISDWTNLTRFICFNQVARAKK